MWRSIPTGAMHLPVVAALYSPCHCVSHISHFHKGDDDAWKTGTPGGLHFQVCY